MNLMPAPLLTTRNRYRPLLNRLATLFGGMDRAYAAVADQYGFRCNGCVDNCCLTRFHHHTFLEYLYLAEGVRVLEPDLRRTVQKQALTVYNEMAEADRRGEALRIMCPLNRDGRCMAYNHRPMICRLHGIPHELRRPGGKVVKNPGCDAFLNQCRDSGTTVYIRFDRTPYYRQMAMLETEFRRKTGYADKIKLTIAQMLMSTINGTYEID